MTAHAPPPDADHEQLLAELNGARTGFSAVLGLTYTSVADDRVEAHLEADERLHQPFGLVHGGVYCAIVEEVGSFAGSLVARRDGRYVVGVANSTDFLRAHRTGRLDVVAEPIHLGRSQQLWLVVVRAHDGGRTVARGQLRVAVLDAGSSVGGARAAASVGGSGGA